MTRYEYKVCPAPTKGRKAKGLKTPEARFAAAVESEINALAAEGWEYQRTDILPSDERQGLTSSQTVYRTVMVFRRALDQGIPPLEHWPAEDVTRAQPQAPTEAAERPEDTDAPDQPDPADTAPPESDPDDKPRP